MAASFKGARCPVWSGSCPVAMSTDPAATVAISRKIPRSQTLHYGAEPVRLLAVEQSHCQARADFWESVCH